MPIVTRKTYNKSIIEIPIGSGNTGKYSVLDLSFIPPFGRADAVELEQTISLYCPALPVSNNTYIFSSNIIIKFHSNCSGNSRVQRKWSHCLSRSNFKKLVVSGAVLDNAVVCIFCIIVIYVWRV